MSGLIKFVQKGKDELRNLQKVLSTEFSSVIGGPVVQIGEYKVQLAEKIAEGGFAFVFLGKEVNTLEIFAVKRIISSDRSENKRLKEEIETMKRIPPHKNIVGLRAHTTLRNTSANRDEIFILMDFAGKSLYSILDQQFGHPFPEQEVLRIFSDVCEGVRLLHSLNPPLAHRDIKVENVLVDGSQTYRLCDFGSASSKTYQCQNQSEMNRADDDFTRNTTMTYRSPEMLDLYRRQLINEKVDIWALGCLLYRICFFVHPFDETSKLSILNVKYEIPKRSSFSQGISDLIKFLLDPDPATRPNIHQVLDRIFAMRSLPPPSLEIQPEYLAPAKSAAPSISASAFSSSIQWEGEKKDPPVQLMGSLSHQSPSTLSTNVSPPAPAPSLGSTASQDSSSLFFSESSAPTFFADFSSSPLPTSPSCSSTNLFDEVPISSTLPPSTNTGVHPPTVVREKEEARCLPATSNATSIPAYAPASQIDLFSSVLPAAASITPVSSSSNAAHHRRNASYDLSSSQSSSSTDFFSPTTVDRNSHLLASSSSSGLASLGSVPSQVPLAQRSSSSFDFRFLPSTGVSAFPAGQQYTGVGPLPTSAASPLVGQPPSSGFSPLLANVSQPPTPVSSNNSSFVNLSQAAPVSSQGKRTDPFKDLRW